MAPDTARPAQYSRLGAVGLNVMVLCAQFERAQTSVRVHGDFSGYGVGETEVIGGRQSVHEHARLVASGRRGSGLVDLPVSVLRRGRSYKPRVIRRMSPIVVMRESAWSTASRELRSKKIGRSPDAEGSLFRHACANLRLDVQAGSDRCQKNIYAVLP
jgi:hypothetical protein